MKIHKGMIVKTLVEKTPYYSGYAGRKKVIIPTGEFGTVTAVKVPHVSRQGFFNCVSFDINGETWIGAYKTTEIEDLYAHDPIQESKFF